ncbi:metal cation symporter ZIP14-like [Haliotis rubra]|uniref:metal cation symporter ZIP14-like n=1 Tax=Haliotis rubra TaxID=36100 RepID=UPI001EE5958A|nr:metal cation symporter ZIP14-like [Haliotis rubra]
MSLLLLFLVLPTASSTAVVEGFSPLMNADTLISKYSSSSSLTQDEFHALFSSLKLHVKQNFGQDGILGSETDAVNDDAWCQTVLNNTANTTCGQAKCARSEDVFNAYAVNASINSSSLLHALPAIVIALEEDHCRAQQHADTEKDEGPRKPTDAEAWGYGLGVVLTVCLISNLGAFLTPLMNSSFFQKLLMFLVAVAIGTQAGAGIVVLIPESMHLMYIEETKDTYLWKACSVLGGIVFVLLLERILKIAFHQIKSAKERTVAEISVEVGSTVTMSTTSSASEDTDSNNSDLPVAVTTTVIGNGASNGNAHTHTSINGTDIRKTSDVEADAGGKVKQQIATVAWMVLLGDAIHKLVDGLSVGAAFTENITTGLTLAISILCEEIPHELGDVSILLHSGMTMKQALTYNTLSAAMGIPGVIVGIFLGETTSANQWIFAIAGGIFIYVPLADMIPEMGHAVDKALKEETGAIFLSILQLLGLCLGFGIIILVAAYAGEIEL